MPHDHNDRILTDKSFPFKHFPQLQDNYLLDVTDWNLPHQGLPLDQLVPRAGAGFGAGFGAGAGARSRTLGGQSEEVEEGCATGSEISASARQ